MEVIKRQMKLTVLDAAPREWTASHTPTPKAQASPGDLGC